MLHDAVSSGEVKIIEYLIEKGLNINQADSVSDTVCMVLNLSFSMVTIMVVMDLL